MAKILLIEDDRASAEKAMKTLKLAGHSCKLETSGENALDLVRQDHFDLVILDVMLPGTSGFEICRRFRRDSALFTIPILILSAMGSEEEIVHGLAQGADDYITKPFDPANLNRRIEALLRSGASKDVDEQTSLPGPDATKREIQRRLSLKEPFGLACAELIGLREFARKYGKDCRATAIRHFARTLEKCGEHAKIDTFFLGHMGGGYFVCMMPQKLLPLYCDWVAKVWEGHIPKLFAQIGHPESWKKKEGQAAPSHRTGRPEVLMCATLYEDAQRMTLNKLFDVLTQLRHKAVATGNAGTHFDRRNTNGPTQTG